MVMPTAGQGVLTGGAAIDQNMQWLQILNQMQMQQAQVTGYYQGAPTFERQQFEAQWSMQMQQFEQEQAARNQQAAAQAAQMRMQGPLMEAQAAALRSQTAMENAKFAFTKEQWAKDFELKSKYFGLDAARLDLERKAQGDQFWVDQQKLELQRQSLQQDADQFAQTLAYQYTQLAAQRSGPQDWVNYAYIRANQPAPKPTGENPLIPEQAPSVPPAAGGTPAPGTTTPPPTQGPGPSAEQSANAAAGMFGRSGSGPAKTVIPFDEGWSNIMGKFDAMNAPEQPASPYIQGFSGGSLQGQQGQAGSGAQQAYGPNSTFAAHQNLQQMGIPDIMRAYYPQYMAGGGVFSTPAPDPAMRARGDAYNKKVKGQGPRWDEKWWQQAGATKNSQVQFPKGLDLGNSFGYMTPSGGFGFMMRDPFGERPKESKHTKARRNQLAMLLKDPSVSAESKARLTELRDKIQHFVDGGVMKTAPTQKPKFGKPSRRSQTNLVTPPGKSGIPRYASGGSYKKGWGKPKKPSNFFNPGKPPPINGKPILQPGEKPPPNWSPGQLPTGPAGPWGRPGKRPLEGPGMKNPPFWSAPPKQPKLAGNASLTQSGNQFHRDPESGQMYMYNPSTQEWKPLSFGGPFGGPLPDSVNRFAAGGTMGSAGMGSGVVSQQKPPPLPPNSGVVQVRPPGGVVSQTPGSPARPPGWNPAPRPSLTGASSQWNPVNQPANNQWSPSSPVGQAQPAPWQPMQQQPWQQPQRFAGGGLFSGGGGGWSTDGSTTQPKPPPTLPSGSLQPPGPPPPPSTVTNLPIAGVPGSTNASVGSGWSPSLGGGNWDAGRMAGAQGANMSRPEFQQQWQNQMLMQQQAQEQAAQVQPWGTPPQPGGTGSSGVVGDWSGPNGSSADFAVQQMQQEGRLQDMRSRGLQQVTPPGAQTAAPPAANPEMQAALAAWQQRFQNMGQGQPQEQMSPRDFMQQITSGAAASGRMGNPQVVPQRGFAGGQEQYRAPVSPGGGGIGVTPQAAAGSFAWGQTTQMPWGDRGVQSMPEGWTQISPTSFTGPDGTTHTFNNGIWQTTAPPPPAEPPPTEPPPTTPPPEQPPPAQPVVTGPTYGQPLPQGWVGITRNNPPSIIADPSGHRWHVDLTSGTYVPDPYTNENNYGFNYPGIRQPSYARGQPSYARGYAEGGTFPFDSGRSGPAIVGDNRPGQRGVNHELLLRDDNTWSVVGSPGRPEGFATTMNHGETVIPFRDIPNKYKIDEGVLRRFADGGVPHFATGGTLPDPNAPPPKTLPTGYTPPANYNQPQPQVPYAPPAPRAPRGQDPRNAGGSMSPQPTTTPQYQQPPPAAAAPPYQAPAPIAPVEQVPVEMPKYVPRPIFDQNGRVITVKGIPWTEEGFTSGDYMYNKNAIQNMPFIQGLQNMGGDTGRVLQNKQWGIGNIPTNVNVNLLRNWNPTALAQAQSFYGQGLGWSWDDLMAESIRNSPAALGGRFGISRYGQ